MSKLQGQYGILDGILPHSHPGAKSPSYPLWTGSRRVCRSCASCAQVYGSTQVEVAWTVIPVLIVVEAHEIAQQNRDQHTGQKRDSASAVEERGGP